MGFVTKFVSPVYWRAFYRFILYFADIFALVYYDLEIGATLAYSLSFLFGVASCIYLT